MSAILESVLDDQRRADCAANDAAMAVRALVSQRLRCFAVKLMAGESLRAQLEVMAFDASRAEDQHTDLLAAGEFIVVRCLEAA